MKILNFLAKIVAEIGSTRYRRGRRGLMCFDYVIVFQDFGSTS